MSSVPYKFVVFALLSCSLCEVAEASRFQSTSVLSDLGALVIANSTHKEPVRTLGRKIAAYIQPDESKTQNQSKPLAAAVEAGLGIEFELTSTSCQGAHSGDVLKRASGWHLEVDARNVEFVFSPVTSFTALEGSLSEVDDLIMKFHMERGRPNEVCPGGLTGTGLILGKLQATMGISLRDLPAAIGRIDDRFKVEFAFIVKIVVEQIHPGVTPDTLVFLTLVAYYLFWGAKKSISRLTAKVAFRLMARSDFCSILGLLDPEEKKQVHVILTNKNFVVRLGNALGVTLGPNMPVLAYEHRIDEGESSRMVRTATTVSEWFKSIENGRPDGKFRKDLPSPPSPYPPYSGNPSIDWSMGALGVDNSRKLVLFEIRGASDRPTDLFGTQLRQIVIQEFKRSKQYNPAMDNTGIPEISSMTSQDVTASASEGFVNAVKAILHNPKFWKSSHTSMVEQSVNVAGLPQRGALAEIIKSLRSALISAIQKETVKDELDRLQALVTSLEDAIWSYTRDLMERAMGTM